VGGFVQRWGKRLLLASYEKSVSFFTKIQIIAQTWNLFETFLYGHGTKMLHCIGSSSTDLIFEPRTSAASPRATRRGFLPCFLQNSHKPRLVPCPRAGKVTPPHRHLLPGARLPISSRSLRLQPARPSCRRDAPRPHSTNPGPGRLPCGVFPWRSPACWRWGGRHPLLPPSITSVRGHARVNAEPWAPTAWSRCRQ